MVWHTQSLEDPVILVVADIAFIIFTLPTFVVWSLLPCLVEVNDLLLWLSFNLYAVIRVMIDTKFEKWQKFFPYMHMQLSKRAISFGAHISIQNIISLWISYQRDDLLLGGLLTDRRWTSGTCFHLSDFRRLSKSSKANWGLRSNLD